MNNNYNTPSQAVDTENLIARMQKEDRRNKRNMYGLFFVYLAFSLIYFFLFVINPDPLLSAMHRFAGILFVIAFMIGTVFLWFRYKKFKNLDYTLPLVQVLEKTVERYCYWGKKWITVSIIIILIDIGFTISYYAKFEYWDVAFWIKILVIQAFYWGLMALAGFVGYLIWRRRSRPIWRDARKLLDELKN